MIAGRQAKMVVINEVWGYRLDIGTFVRQSDTELRTWDTNQDMGHKSGHFRTRGHFYTTKQKKVFINEIFSLWVICAQTWHEPTSVHT